MDRLKKILRLAYDLLTDASVRRYARRQVLAKCGYDFTSWSRVIQQKDWRDFLSEQELDSGDILEISPGNSNVWRDICGKSYSSVQYPDFNICSMSLEKRFDFVIADNVFEHLRHPRAAGKNVIGMLKPGGYFLISTPFMIRVHGHPNDYTRWTADGLRALLVDCGFDESRIRVQAWGNRACTAAYLRRSGWPAYGWGKRLVNEPEFPVMVWAFAQK